MHTGPPSTPGLQPIDAKWLDLAFNIRGYGENTPYSLSEPTESGIVNRQNGGEKLKYILKFYIRDTRMRNDDLALCL